MTAPVLSAAAVVIIAGGLAMAGAFDSPRDDAHPLTTGGPTDGATSRSEAPGPPAGYNLVSYRGLQIAVPNSLIVTHSPCRPPVNAVFIPTGAAYSCPVAPPGRPGVRLPATATGVWLGATPDGPISTTTEPTDHRTAAGVEVTVTAPTQARVDKILGSIRIVTVDPLGCLVHPRSITPPDQPATADLVPDGATSAVVCELAPIGTDHSYWLVGSYPLASATVARLTAVLNALPTRAGKSGFGSLPQYVWIRFSYPDRAVRVIAVPTNYEPAYISDGNRTVVDTHPGTDSLLSLLQQD